MNGLNVLLTGACGRIGKTFFEASKARYRFTLTDRIAPTFDLGEHRFVHADLSDKASLAALLDGIDVAGTCRASPTPALRSTNCCQTISSPRLTCSKPPWPPA